MKTPYAILAILIIGSHILLGVTVYQLIQLENNQGFPSEIPDGASSWYSREYGFLPENYSGFLPYPYWEHPTK